MKPTGLMLAALLLLSAAAPPAAASDEPRTQRIKIDMQPVKTPDHQAVYDLVKQRQWLEKFQEFFGVFKLPDDITIRMMGCDGVSNAWYVNAVVTICYEYVEDIRKGMPSMTTVQGVTPADAVIGQFVYTASHEMGHAIFDVLELPILGEPEDAADGFATYMMLQIGKAEARRLIFGAAYSYNEYLRGPTVTVPLIAFADAHSAPYQRFYNLLCLAYGADRDTFQDLVDRGYLPQSRAQNCKSEYFELNFAFEKLIKPHIDPELEKQVLDKSWLPDPNVALLPSTDMPPRMPGYGPRRKRLPPPAAQSMKPVQPMRPLPR
jgi:hypothetical protein